MPENYGKLFCGILLAALSLTAQSQGWQVPQPSAGLMPNPELMGVASGEKKGPPLLHKIYEPSHHGDVAFQLAVKNGVRAHHWPYGDMAPVPQVTPDDVAHITAYVRAEQRKAGIR